MRQETFEELKAILTEGEFTHRWSIIETYHEIGRLLSEQEGNITELVREASSKLNRGERMFWHSIKFYQTYPNLNLLPEGKNVSMNKIINKYLTEPKQAEEHEHKPIKICSICKIKL